MRVEGPAFEGMRLGDGTLPYVPIMPTVSNVAVIINPVNGMFVYEAATNQCKIYENGGWRVF